MYRLIVLLLLICLFIKQNNADLESSDIAVDTDLYASTQKCKWKPCKARGFPDSTSGYSVDCCTLSVPLNYAQPNETINISMTRFSPGEPYASTKKNTLFVLSGGPGQSGWDLFYFIQLIPSSYGITLILPDHRGTGLSTLLSCDENGSQDVNVDCIKYLKSKYGVNGLKQFSVTSAAHDLSIQIQAYKKNNPSRIAIYAVNYGTFWLNRFLLIYPNLTHSAVMDGLFHPLLSSVSRNDLGVATISYEFLKYCEQQVECGQHFPVNQQPFKMLQNILHQMDLNTQICFKKHLTKFNLNSETLRTLFFNLMANGNNYFDRTIIPAVIFRLNRCNADDISILKHFFRVSLKASNPPSNPKNPPGFLFSNVTNFNIVESEIYLAMNESDVDKSVTKRWYNATVFAQINPLQYNVLRSKWPKYRLDRYRYKISSYSPLLMLNGQIDPTTITYQAEHLASITTKTRTFYEIPLAGHITSTLAQVGYTCPLQLICSWLFPSVFPKDWKNPSCIRDLPVTIDFAGETSHGRDISIKFFNISHPFGPNN
ncbi:unnamed protein product [Adineta steineri]|uniref:AB hydrolase-1 domain-containing protein n=1 Tax=Adineta steineri TaxID=433720 RepID=A0A815S8N5_9BILA|nr:unnamed protein product [Adineta steineri]CAF3781499.1 unnamed protein product [Adineta steineri]